IYDGEKCYLIDPLVIKNMSPLWAIFENKNICKIAYSCSEDIQILKINGCHTKNIFDLQVAAKLCNHTANSYGELIQAEFGVELNKAMQKSNWNDRPLKAEQLIYASNDVIWLIRLFEIFSAKATQNNVAAMLTEENEYCETIVATEYVIKITNKQKAQFGPYFQKVLLALFIVRDSIAEQYNMPPFAIVPDYVLENIIQNKKQFIDSPFAKGFCNKLYFDEINKQRFYEIIENIDTTISIEPELKQKGIKNEKAIFRENAKENVEKNCKKLLQVATQKYGATAADFILRGLKKGLLTNSYSELILRKYQHSVIQDLCSENKITL
ncbi:MAG: ribonuclease D, partial [Ferruginibacter sp.]